MATRLQVVKVLDQIIDASFKRSASSPEEKAFRDRMREIQKRLRSSEHVQEKLKRDLVMAFAELAEAINIPFEYQDLLR